MVQTTFDDTTTVPISLPGVEVKQSARLDWEPIDSPNPVGWEPKSALTGSRPSA